MTAASRPTSTQRNPKKASAKPRLRVVERNAAPKLRRSTAGTLGTLTIVLLMLLAFGAVAVQTLQIQQRLSIDATVKAADVARAEQANLQLEVASLEAPARILAEAQARLGMIPPLDRLFLAPVIPGDLDSPIDPPAEGMFADTSGPEVAADGAAAGGENE